MKEKMFYTPKEAADMLQTSREMVRISLLQRAEGWDFPFVMCGNRMKISKAHFDEWLKKKNEEK